MQKIQHKLRANATDAEKLIWSRLRNRQIGNFKFRRQTPIGRYVVDFVCESSKVIVELDGGQHAVHANGDTVRTQTLEAMGYVVLRLWNHEALENTEGVLLEILDTLQQGSFDDRS